MTNEFIGDKIRRLREQQGLSAAAIQRITDGQLSERTIWRAEIAGVVSSRTIALLAPVLGVTPADLLPGIEAGEP